MLLHYVKRGAYNTFAYSASSIGTRILSFFFLPYFLSKLTLEQFGIWDFYQMLFSMGTLLVSSSAAMGLTRFYLLHKNDPEKQQQAVGNALGLTFIGALLFPLTAFSILHFFNYYPFSSKYLIISILSISFFSLFSLVLAYLRVREYLWLYFFIFCGQNVLALLLTILAVSRGFGIEGFFYANCFSFSLCIPAFIYVFSHHWNFSFPLLKEQLKYSVPLLSYNILYGFFTTIDRLIIKYYCGYETLGTYGLLWRFGAIFQFLSIALIDALFIMLFNAQKENDSDALIAKIITYFSIVLTSGCLIALVGARCAIELFFPDKYYYLINYLPLFFLPVIFLELARMAQIGIILSNKTFFTPIITATILGIQTIILIFFQLFGLWGIFIGNTLSFIIYSLVNHRMSSKLYCPEIYHNNIILKLLALFIVYSMGFYLLFATNTHWFISILMLATWPITLLLTDIINNHEKNILYEKIKIFLENTINKKSRRTHAWIIKKYF